jgi:hypothetical protein
MKTSSFPNACDSRDSSSAVLFNFNKSKSFLYEENYVLSHINTLQCALNTLQCGTFGGSIYTEMRIESEVFFFFSMPNYECHCDKNEILFTIA